MHRRITGKLVVATHNPGKLAEMKELLAPYGIDAVRGQQFTHLGKLAGIVGRDHEFTGDSAVHDE